MICIYFVGGSHFTRHIPSSKTWLTYFKKQGYVVKQSRVADMDIMIDECSKFINICNNKYNNPAIGVVGVSSGGYFALRLKKILYKLQFCVGIAPIVNPILRSNIVKSPKIIRATPNVRKIYNKIDNDTLIIVGKNDTQAPLSIYNGYDIQNMIIMNNLGHDITNGTNMIVYREIHNFLK
jgi:esterase/lipase